MKSKILYTLLFFAVFSTTIFSQEYKENDSIYMTWNANTPETEMNDDIKALKEHGVTITYSNVKRNDKKEITTIDISFESTTGTKGSLSYNSQKPIPIIKVFKQNDEVGFGEPSNADFMFGNTLANGFNPNDIMKGFQFNGNEDGLPGQQYHFEFPNGSSFGQSSSKIFIQKDGKKPLVIQDGNVIEGGDDYTKEEIDKIKENHKMDSYQKDHLPLSNNNNFEIQEQMKKMQEQIDNLIKSQRTQPNKEYNDELEKAKKELEDVKKELKKAKSSLKNQKA
ncbi:hypothetical protein [Flavobacterium sp.]|jgi:hypothetical protein|uniref:hypothetical protein n=1 Tax=Flavobacterium sp. TaxID=239 RepID=UPI0037C193C1